MIPRAFFIRAFHTHPVPPPLQLYAHLFSPLHHPFFMLLYTYYIDAFGGWQGTSLRDLSMLKILFPLFFFFFLRLSFILGQFHDSLLCLVPYKVAVAQIKRRCGNRNTGQLRTETTAISTTFQGHVHKPIPGKQPLLFPVSGCWFSSRTE